MTGFLLFAEPGDTRSLPMIGSAAQKRSWPLRMFQWACADERIPPEVYHRLVCVKGLRPGPSGAKERPLVECVPEEHVDAVLPFLTPLLSAMLKLQCLTRMRSGELCAMKACAIETGKEVWVYHPPRYNTSHLGHEHPMARLAPSAKRSSNPS